jgi:hypothetical protein
VSRTAVRGHDEADNAKRRFRIHLNTKRRFATLLLAVLIWTSGAAACGVQEGQEDVEKARQVGEQMEQKQGELEEKLQEGQ